MRLLKLTLLAVVLFATGMITYEKLPLSYKYAISDWYDRQGTPNYVQAPDLFTSSDQASVVRELEESGHKLKCYGNLGDRERIDKNDDYLCSAHIATAYNDIPARLITFFFANEKLNHVRIEFASESFEQLQDYLSTNLTSYKRLDKSPWARFDKGLMVWKVKDGLVVASSEKFEGGNPIILWSSFSAHRNRHAGQKCPTPPPSSALSTALADDDYQTWCLH